MKIGQDNFFEAIKKSLVNAEELFEEASILKNHSRIARAYTLYQLCIEEAGKAILIYSFILEGDKTKINKFLNEIRNHKLKTSTSIGLEMILAMHLQDNNLKKKVIINSHRQTESVDKINDYKNYSLYTSLINDKFYLPSEIITQKDLDDIEFNAIIRLNIAKQFLEIGIKEFDGVQSIRKTINEEELLEEMRKKVENIFKE